MLTQIHSITQSKFIVLTVSVFLIYYRKMLFPECKLFRDIAQCRSFLQAAKLNGISQPAVTQSIKELEKRLGVTLINRSTRPIALTAAGELYDALCGDVLVRDADFQAGLEDLQTGGLATVRVASIYSIGLSEAPRLREEFNRAMPGARLVIDFLHPAEVYAAVLSGQVDFGFVSYPEERRGIRIVGWRKEQMTVALYPGHPLAGHRRIVARDLNGQSFLAFDHDVPIRQALDRFFEDNDVHLSIAAHFDNIQSIKEAVAMGQGISILPARTMEAEVKQGRLASVPLDVPGLVRPTAVIHRTDRKLSRAALTLLSVVKRGSKEDGGKSGARRRKLGNGGGNGRGNI